MASLDRERLLRDYAPRLAQRADVVAGPKVAGPKVPGGTVNDVDTLGGLLDLEVVGDVDDVKMLPPTKKADDGEPETEPVETEDTGVMVAFYLPPDVAEELALDPDQFDGDDIDIEEADELHLTLAYLGTAGIDVTPDQLDTLAQTVAAWAVQIPPFTGVVSGIGVFNNEDSVVTYASFDSPQLPHARQLLVQMLAGAGVPSIMNHGFTPHITLAYGDARGVDIPRLGVTFTNVTIAYGGDQVRLQLGDAPAGDAAPVIPSEAKSVPLGQDVPPEDDPDGDGADPEGQDDNDSKVVKKEAPPRPQFIATDRSLSPTLNQAQAQARAGSTSSTPTSTNGTGVTWSPVVTTNGMRTIITGPATTERAAMWGQAPNANPHMMWMQGRFVGAERPNRNGAYWSTGDLEVGRPTVAHGPLNWLHEERHVIGTIADAKFVPGEPGAQLQVASERAAATGDPHITALSGIWSWIYPQEASVVQMASDAGVLAYSMECIAQAIQCVGDDGCGQTFPYMQVAATGGGCAHLQQRASTRRLVNPTFLGGAVIVPPTRPGWADADASVLKEAASMAEQAYDQAGRPDIPASTWEQLMTSVMTYTKAAQ